MKFSFIQDMDFMSQGGGAQNTDRAHFVEGIRKGHDMAIVTPQADIGALRKSDAVIVSNMMASFGPDLFHELIQRDIPSIWFFHDYQPVCKYRLFYPMLDKCKNCHRKPTWLPILLAAHFLIWLSPLHRESWLWACPELEGKLYALVPSPVNPKDFYDMGLRRNGVVCLSSLFPFKGRDNVLRWAEEHPDETLTCISSNPMPEKPLPPNCRDIGDQSYWALNEIYNQHQAFLHLPGTPQPFDRAVAESYLAGCQIIGNPLIGALSYDWFTSREEVAEHCGNSPKLFWEKIEEVL